VAAEVFMHDGGFRNRRARFEWAPVSGGPAGAAEPAAAAEPESEWMADTAGFLDADTPALRPAQGPGQDQLPLGA
jgi:hypothetical protein